MSDTPPDDSEFVDISLTPEGNDPPAADDGAADDAADGEKPEGDASAEGEYGQNEGDAADGDDEALREERAKGKNGAQGRIAELTRLRREAEREAEHWKGIATQNGAKPGDSAAPASKPNADDFEDYGEFVEALTDWKVAERERATASTRAEAAEKTVAETRDAEWGARIGAVKATIPDFDAVMEKADTPTAPHVAAAIMEADRGPELLYHLAAHPEIVEKLNDLSPYRAAVELGRIEASLGETVAPAPPPPPEPKKPSNAPAPITPVKGGTATTKDPAKMDMAEYKAWRAEQLK